MSEKKKEKNKIWEKYEIKNGKIIRKKRFCPRCGPGTFMAEHKERYTCGKCSYVEYKKAI
ncbi:MAG: 30S ribosomal protein S27ae [Nitrososphaerota archaeon]